MRFVPVWTEDNDRVMYIAESLVRFVSVNPDNTLHLTAEYPKGPYFECDTVKGGIIADGLQNVRPTYNTMLVSNKEVKERLAKNGNS